MPDTDFDSGDTTELDALLRAGVRETLAMAQNHSPKILKTLLAARPGMPPITPGVSTPGGEDED